MTTKKDSFYILTGEKRKTTCTSPQENKERQLARPHRRINKDNLQILTGEQRKTTCRSPHENKERQTDNLHILTGK